MADHLSTLDVAAAHRFFAADCFNRAWDLIEKADRTAEDDRLMVALNQASIFHWLNRPDVTAKNMSIGYWQASRIQALLGNAAEALRCARVCLEYSTDLEPFYIGYAYEAMARASALLGDRADTLRYLTRAEAFAARAPVEERARLNADLEGLLGDAQRGDG